MQTHVVANHLNSCYGIWDGCESFMHFHQSCVNSVHVVYIILHIQKLMSQNNANLFGYCHIYS